VNAERYQQVKALFLEAHILPREEREAFLTRWRCADTDLCAELVRLMAAHDDSRDGFLEPAALGLPIPERLKNYRILGVLGAGGMGVVYQAEQENPRRTVALKVIRPGLASGVLLRRFEYEAQFLGRLQHPGIAQIFEADTADTGYGPQPFFAMELVRGQPITDYARAHALDTRARLALLIQVCEAVAHAHQNGVIHRDLKPGNILVHESGQPKILDFGVARATDADVQATTLGTSLGQIVGTVPYMSPEQLSGRAEDVDTRCDVYALGVLAYELLAERPPFELAGQSLLDAVRVIRDQEPIPLRNVNRRFRGDLDTLTAKALEKDKTRRYPSADALAADLRRFLRHEPISARPPSARYQMHKFALRHRGLVAGLATALAMLLLGAGVSATLAVRATRQRDRARQAEQLAEQRLAQVQQEAAKFQAVNRVLEEMLTAPDPWERHGAAGNPRDTRVVDVLDEAERALPAALAGQPEVEAAARTTIGRTYWRLGDLEKAEANARRAVELRREHLGEEHPDTLEATNNLAAVLVARGRLSEAEPLLRTTLEIQRRVTGSDDERTLTTMNNLGNTLQNQGRLAEAEPLYREVLEARRRVLGQEHTDTLSSLSNLATLVLEQRRLGEAERLMREVLEMSRRVLGAEHPHTLALLNNLAALLKEQGRLSDAEPLHRLALATRQRTLGNEHPDTLLSAHNLAGVLYDMGSWPEAEALYRDVVMTRARVLGADHPETLRSMNNRAVLLRRLRRLDEAEQLQRKVLAARRRVLGDEHADTLRALSNLGTVLEEQGKLADAEGLYRQSLEVSRRILGDDHPRTLAALSNLAGLLSAQGKPSEAEPLYQTVVRTAPRALPAGHWQIALYQGLYGQCLVRLQRYEQAEAELLQSYAGLVAALGASHERTLRAVERLVTLYEAWGRSEQAAEWQAKLPTTGRDSKSQPHREQNGG